MSHAIDSPSALSRRRLCPGSRRIEQEYGVSSTSEAAASGTHTHWLVEHCLTEGKAPVDMIGVEMEDEEGLFVVDEERAERATVMVDYVNIRMFEIVGAVLHCEVKVDPGKTLGRMDMEGTADVVIVGQNEIEVIDYKDGFMHVSPHDNDQTRAYLLGALNEFGDKPVRTTTIVQPRNTDQGFEPIGGESIEGDEIWAWAKQVKEDLALADQPEAEASPGEKQCQWCDARGACQARAQWALTGVTFPVVAGETVPDKTEAVVEQLGAMDLTLITDAEIERMLPFTAVVKEVMKSIEAEAVARLKKGTTLGGWWLKKTYGNRAWSKPEEEVRKRLNGRKLKKADIYKETLRSPTQILKNKQLTKAQKAWIEDNLIERKETGVALASPGADGQSAMPSAPKGMFQPVTSPQGEPAFMQAPKLENK